MTWIHGKGCATTMIHGSVTKEDMVNRISWICSNGYVLVFVLGSIAYEPLKKYLVTTFPHMSHYFKSKFIHYFP
jgi:hypothetical protein